MSQNKIDVHLHASHANATDDGSPRPLIAFPGPPIPDDRTPVTDEGILKLTLDAMDRNQVEVGLVSGDDPTLIKTWTDEAPGRFLVGRMVSGMDDSPPVEELRDWHQDGRLHFMGEVMGQYRGLQADDVRLEPYFALAEELDIPALIHIGGLGAPRESFRIGAGSVASLEEVMIRHPELRLWVENAGFPFFEQMMSVMYRYPNVYVDVSTITWIIPRPLFISYLNRLADASLIDRVMFGSDQMVWPQTISMAIETIEVADCVSDGQKRGIFYENAARFLRLDESA